MQSTIRGKAYVLGDNVDTDQIIPAQYLTLNPSIPAEYREFGKYALSSVPPDQAGLPKGHVPFHGPEDEFVSPYTIIVAGKNFGCGSSREHAPQALYRWGIKALVGESFADIFFGNCVAMGIPCVIVSEADAAKLMAAIEKDPAHDMTVDVDARTVTFNGLTVAATLPDGARTQLMKGTWDATRILVDALPQVKETAAKLPYTRAFAS